MKRTFGFALILALSSIPALAASNSQTVTFPGAVTVGASQLPAGEYKVSWTGTGSSVQVTIAKKGITPVTLAAKLVEQKHEHAGVTTNTLNGVDILQTIELNRVSLVIAGPQTPGQ